MKRIIVALLLLSSVSAFAETAKETPKPTCGKTVEDCQKVVDSLTAQVAQTTLAYQAVRTQRDQVQANLSDQQVTAYIAQQTKK